MPDAPDSYFYSHISTLVPSTDVNELAARLSSPASVLREGQVLYQNDFRDGLKGLDIQTTGANVEIFVDTNTSTLTGNTLIMSTDSATYIDCAIIKSLPLFDTSKFIYSFLIAGTSNTAIKVFITIFKDGYLLTPRFEINLETGKVYYFDSSLVAQEITLVEPIYLGPDGNMRIQLTVNVDTKYYVSFYLNDHSYDLSNAPLYNTPDTSPEYQSIELQTKRVSGITNANSYVNAIVVSASD